MASFFLSLLTLVSLVTAQKCSLQFDGRMKAGSTPASFDSATTSLFDPKNVFGQNLTWGQIIQMPTNLTASLPASIFAPSASNIQTGFRRAELLPASVNGSDPSTIGVKTLHFSLQKDVSRPLNLSHEYQLAFLESADFSTNQFVLKTGTILGGSSTDPNRLVVVSNVNEGAFELFATNFTEGWHNFGIVLDFNANTIQVLHSISTSPLQNVTAVLPNNIAGRGQYHFGMLKKPTNFAAGADITKSGFQEGGINEGMVFGGIFMEDSLTGCVSLS